MPSTAMLPNPTPTDKTSKETLYFLLDRNLGLPADGEPWKSFLDGLGIRTELSTDLVDIHQQVAEHKPDIAYIPIADFHRLIGKGDDYYHGFVISTSKFTGSVDLPSVLVVRKDDAAKSLEDLQGATYGYIDKSCSSSYFPPAIMLEKQGKQLDHFLKIKPVKAWQGQVDAVISKEVRATMVPEDVWKITPRNDEETRVIGRYDNGKPAMIVARQGLDEELSKKLLERLVRWSPKWEAVYGPFRPYLLAEVFSFFHDLDALPPGF
jgi:ABC-type phosphate/phosphonate transport system substrate-binding protein